MLNTPVSVQVTVVARWQYVWIIVTEFIAMKWLRFNYRFQFLFYIPDLRKTLCQVQSPRSVFDLWGVMFDQMPFLSTDSFKSCEYK